MLIERLQKVKEFMTTEQPKEEIKKPCDHVWKDCGYGFGLVKCKKCGEVE